MKKKAVLAKKNWKNTLLVLLIPFLFLMVGIITLGDYGLNWDEPFHFAKGHAILHYMLTGKRNYLNLPQHVPFKGDSDFVDQFGNEQEDYTNAPKSEISADKNFRRSYYQSDLWTFDYLSNNSIFGHPEINDLLAAFSNYIFYQKLDILGDVESHHLFEIISSFAIALGVGFFTYKKIGLIPSMVSVVAIVAYPLFFSESHFNIKDPPLASFYGLTIIFFYLGVVKDKWIYIILSALFCALAIGVKFNALLVFPVIMLWLIFYKLDGYFKKNNEFKFRDLLTQNKRTLLYLLAFTASVIAIFYLLSPTFWADPIERLKVIISYYKRIAVGTPEKLQGYLVGGFNTYSLFWFLYTTPIPFLILLVVGISKAIFSLILEKENKDFYFLLLVWFFLPFVRVVLPNTNIYGGIRQIIEFLPAMAILIGLGFDFLARQGKKINGKYLLLYYLIIFIGFSFVVWENIKIHPNQNVYFNQLVGGLKGAEDKNIPYWGNSYGNVYLQGIDWLNDNVEKDAKLGMPISSTINFPRMRLRNDINVSNNHLSAFLRKGEYEMELFFDWDARDYYRYAYYDKYLEPVYTVEVEGVPLLKIWKNDQLYLKKGFEKEIYYNYKQTVESNKLQLDFSKKIFITKLIIEHSLRDCIKEESGFVYLSDDNLSWQREIESIGSTQIASRISGRDEDTFIFLFPAKKVRYLLLETSSTDLCVLKNPKVTVMGLELLPED